MHVHTRSQQYYSQQPDGGDRWIEVWTQWSVHPSECYSARNTYETLVHATTCTNLKNGLWGEKGQAQKATYYMTAHV